MPRSRTIEIDVDVHRAIETARRTFSESENDILRRLLVSVPERAKADAAPPAIRSTSTPPVSPRARGLWTVRIGADRYSAANLKEAYRVLLEQLSARDPQFLAAFANEGGRSRRFVAKRPEELYANSPHLARDHAKLLADGWYFDTNLSTEQVAQRARVAARVAGLLYGRDVQLLDNLREI